jgi:predicted RNA binding protein YcfA (HicA-like mRNA interferase family)
VPELPVISGTECIRALAKLGYEVARTRGSHVRLSYPGRPPTTVPLHRELDRGTLRSIIRQTELTVEEFVDLID